MPRPPAGYIAPSGDVMVPPELARILFEQRGGLRDFRNIHRGKRADLDSLLEAIRLAGAKWAGSDRGTERAETAEVVREWFTTQQAGDRLKVGSRRVVQLIASHKLEAEWHGLWLIHVEALRHYEASRSESER